MKKFMGGIAAAMLVTNPAIAQEVPTTVDNV